VVCELCALSECPFANHGVNIVTSMVIRAGRHGIPEGMRNGKDPIVQALVKAIGMCSKQNPADRASAEEVQDMLRPTGQQ